MPWATFGTQYPLRPPYYVWHTDGPILPLLPPYYVWHTDGRGEGYRKKNVWHRDGRGEGYSKKNGVRVCVVLHIGAPCTCVRSDDFKNIL